MAPPSQTFNLDVEAISGICGSISIACWVVVFSPQIIQNFQRSSADALSVQFVIVWLLGDVFNIIGAVMQGVLPTMVILAFYYTIADIVLLLQCFYYRGLTWRDEPIPAPKASALRTNEPNERTDLLVNHRTRRGSTDWEGLSPAVSHIPEAPLPPTPPSVLQTIMWNATVVIMVCAAGVMGWYLGHEASGSKDKAPYDGEGDDMTFNVVGQVFGYLCAVAYIASRMPQLVLNWRRKTTDGLSMLFFLFACLGNITYVLSIFAYDPKCRGGVCDPGEAKRIYAKYMLVNLSWLLGSLLTLFLDLGVFAQYFIYRDGESPGPSADQSESEQEDSGRDSYDQRPLLQRNDSTYP